MGPACACAGCQFVGGGAGVRSARDLSVLGSMVGASTQACATIQPRTGGENLIPLTGKKKQVKPHGDNHWGPTVLFENEPSKTQLLDGLGYNNSLPVGGSTTLISFHPRNNVVR